MAKEKQPDATFFLKVLDVVKQAFSERRKMVRSTLKPLFENPKVMLETFAVVGIKETARAEELPPEIFEKLAFMLK